VSYPPHPLSKMEKGNRTFLKPFYPPSPPFQNGKGEQNLTDPLMRTHFARNSRNWLASSVGFSSGMKWPQSAIEPPLA